MAERFELADEAASGAFGVAALEVVAAGLAVELTGREHVPAGGEDRVADGDRCAAVAATLRGLGAPVTAVDVWVDDLRLSVSEEETP